jgi:hypothetical protein
MEPLWSPGVATSGNQRQIGWTRNTQEQAESIATGCHQLPMKFMLRRGSTVRVRQRALQKAPHTGAFRFGSINPGARRVTVGSLKERCNEQREAG